MFEIWSVGCKPFEDKTAVEVSYSCCIYESEGYEV